MKCGISQQASGACDASQLPPDHPFIHNLKHEYGVTVAVLVSDSVSQWHCNGHNWCHRPFTLFTMFGKVVLPCKVECKGRNLALAELGVRRIDVAVATLVLCSEAAFGWE